MAPAPAMRFPQEIVVDRLIPTIRALLARDLNARGLTQAQIAERLGVTQSAVSKHLVGRFKPDPVLAADPRLVETVERVGNGLASGMLGPVEALGEFLRLVRELENRGPVCALHEAEMPSLRGLGCDLCVRPETSALLAESAVLADVRAAIRLLEAEPAAAAIIPHVGSNVCAALPDAAEAARVAGVPGNLFVLHGRVAAPASPAFGVSRHVAEVLLAARRVNVTRVAAMNVRTDPRVLDAARAQGLSVADVSPRVERDPAAAGDAPADASVLAHGGDFGIEAQTYVLGPSAVAVAERVVALARAAGAHP